MIGKMLMVRYVAFAIAAVLANLATQRVVLQFGETLPLFVAAVAAGTAAGLLLKYALDKRWVFYDQQTGVSSHRRKFIAYTATGLVTTAMFWIIELAFWMYWRTSTMREVGAILGLSIGYALKYFLDRRFVFRDSNMAPST